MQAQWGHDPQIENHYSKKLRPGQAGRSAHLVTNIERERKSNFILSHWEQQLLSKPTGGSSEPFFSLTLLPTPYCRGATASLLGPEVHTGMLGAKRAHALGFEQVGAGAGLNNMRMTGISHWAA